MPAGGLTVLVGADGATPVREIAAALVAQPPGAGGSRAGPRAAGTGRESPPGPPPATIHIDGVPLDPAMRLDASPLRDGSVVVLGLSRPGPAAGSETRAGSEGRAGSEAGAGVHRVGTLSPVEAEPAPGARRAAMRGRSEPIGLVEVRVTGGPGAGVVHRLLAGEYGIGTDPAGGIELHDPEAPRRALTLRVGVDGSCTLTPVPGADVRIDGCRHDGPVPLRSPGTHGAGGTAELRIGPVRLLVAPPSEPDGLLRASSSGAGLEISREPRILRPADSTRYRLPALPAPSRSGPLPVLAAVLPAAAAVGMAVLLHAYYLLLFAALAPLSLLSSYVSTRRHNAREHLRDLTEYHRTRAEIDREAAEALERETAAAHATHPDPATVLLRAVGPRRGLWERRPEDPDFLHLRVGTADLPGGVVVDDPAAPEHRRQARRTARDAPAVVALPEVGVLGVVGGGGLAQVVGCWLAAQAAVHHSPRDLVIQVVSESESAWVWSWARWLPHCRPAGGPPGIVLVGADAHGRARRADQLVELVAERTRRARRSGGTPAADPAVLVIVDGTASTRTALLPVLRGGPSVGVTVVCLERDPRQLPPECRAIVEQTAAGLRIRREGSEPVESVLPDLVATAAPGGIGTVVSAAGAAAWCEQIARALAPIRDPGPDEGRSSAMPTEVRLLDLLDLEPPSVRALAPRWVTEIAGGAFPIGASPDGPVDLDLGRDGPHALVAGTTGSGKSEFLQSMVAALAVRNRPDEMTFVLVDYKGGSAFGDCALLPHTVGLVTDLDPHLVRRALDSLGAELRRRESLLAAAGAKDVDGYGRAVRRTRGRLEALPRLVVVVDEFAALVRELPDFVVGLVGLAARGRSLGMHLVLATQRPAGVVSPEIMANTNLRVALRVTDQAESMDVLGLPDAAFIPVSSPGRAIVRVGQGAPMTFQTGRIGGPRPAGGPKPAARRPPVVVPLPWPQPDDILDRITQAEKAAAIRDARFGPARAIGSRVPSENSDPADSRGPAECRITGDCGGPGSGPDGRRLPDGPGRVAARPASVSRALAADPEPTTGRTSNAPSGGADGGTTDLHALARALRESARVCRIPDPRRPWLPPLPTRTTLGALPPVVGPAPRRIGPTVPPVPLALADLCGAQAQPTFAVDLERGGHLMIVGSPRSGRSTTLRTFAGSVAAAVSSHDAHLYGLDCGNNSLAPLAALPHTGAVVNVTEPERVYRLLARLAAEVGRRQDMLAAEGFADLAEARRAGAVPARVGPAGARGNTGRVGEPSTLPYLVLLLDGYEGFLASFEEMDGAMAVDRLLGLARDGPAIGLRLLVATDRRGLTGRLSSAVEQRLVLRMAEPADYGLAGLVGMRIPDVLPPGRGFLLGGGPAGAVGDPVWANTDGPVELQVALLADDPSGPGQSAALGRLAERARRRDDPTAEQHSPRRGAGAARASPRSESPPARRPPRRPFRVDALPSRVSAREVAALRAPPPSAVRATARQPPAQPPPAGQPVAGQPVAGQPRAEPPAGDESARLLVTVGVGGDELGPLEIDLDADGPGFVVAGPPRSGRSCTLVTIADELLAQRAHLVIVTPRPSPLRLLAGREGVHHLSGLVNDAVLPRPSAGTRTVVLVDDAELVGTAPLGDELTAFLRGARDTGGALIAAGTTEDLVGQFRGPVVEARRSRCGVLLAPASPADGDLFGVRLARAVCGPAPPGRGLLLRHGEWTPLQVTMPLPE